MAVSGIGNTYTYVYNTQTGKLSTKDGSKNDFVDYFNGESSEEALDTLNGFDAKRKDNIQNMIEVFEQASKGGITKALFDSSKGTEFEISEEIENATTAHYSIDGKQVFTAYSAVSYTYEEVKIFGTITNFPYKNHQHRDYDPETNSIGIAVGDEFDMGNGYRFKVLEDRIWGEGWGSGTEEDDKKANQFMWGLSGLIHFGDQQSMASRIDKETTPMMLEFLRQLGVDTSREFIINETRCEIMYGRIKEVGNMVGVPSSIQNAAVKRYEELLYKPLSTWKERNRQTEEQVEKNGGVMV